MAGNRLQISDVYGAKIKELLILKTIDFVDLCINPVASVEGNAMFYELFEDDKKNLLKMIFIIDSWAADGEPDLDWGQMMEEIDKDFKLQIIKSHKKYREIEKSFL